MIDELISRLGDASDIIEEVYWKIHDAGVNDSDIDHLASLNCEIDEAIGELEDLKGKSA